VKNRHVALGRRISNRSLAFRMAENLLSGVIVTAGGVEHALAALRREVARAQVIADKHITVTPGVPHGLQDESATAAWYEFANLITWARAFDERLDRRARPSKLRNQGLLPAIQPKRLRKRVQAEVGRLRAGPLGETRFLANFTLHADLVRHSFSGVSVDDGGSVRLPIPDSPRTHIDHWHVLTWADDRDGVEFAEALWQSIESFMDALLDAFEKATPKRLRKGGKSAG